MDDLQLIISNVYIGMLFLGIEGACCQMKRELSALTPPTFVSTGEFFRHGRELREDAR
jgi:hypothetical protein